jgi:hypothetical protein
MEPMNTVMHTLRGWRRLTLQAAESAFENPALFAVVILGGLTVFWAVEGNIYGIVSSVIAMLVALLVALRYARR